MFHFGGFYFSTCHEFNWKPLELYVVLLLFSREVDVAPGETPGNPNAFAFFHQG